MFGLGKKKGFDLLLLKPDSAEKDSGRRFIQILFPSIAANDFVQLMLRLQKSNLNTKEILGDIGGFTILSHVEGLEKITVMDEVQPEAEPIPFQDFSNQLLNRFNSMLNEEEHMEEAEDEDMLEADGQDDLVYFIGEFTLMKDGSF
ncbi:hypothetical protein [Ammoniphilus sp. CFH 90114]|uniref:hypothetical protein n=1 Tax=Ammoniphilus sp. CFH 90114 TaxID=2493665 RepID=UPI00100EB88A|nr:hypothetical protein [Ammoniphilus sp. CFH 90114]RXT14952.1 hypothetical protein EIZ39_01720 [Ammoniphilus sp. CFH 90114]